LAWDIIRGRLQQAWPAIRKGVLNPTSQADAGDIVADLARQNAGVIWLLGKVQSGKSSIVKALTGVESVEIGEGFAACTKRSYVYDFPEDAPVVRFLDTRGLGEIAYDPTEDMSWCETQAHLLLVVMRVSDPEQEAIVKAVAEIRDRHREWPIIVAQTCLHHLYPADGVHPLPFPFSDPDSAANISHELLRAIAYQRSLLKDVGGSGPIQFVPLDFTLEEDGFEPRDYGLSALEDAVQKSVAVGLLAARRGQVGVWRAAMARSAQPHILGYASAAGAADIVPAVGLVAVPTIQAKLLHSLASIYDTPWNRQYLTEFASALGLGIGVRYAVGFLARQLGKLVPVYGQTAAATFAAAASFATTYALGKAAGVYMAQRQIGKALDAREISDAYAEALDEAFELAKKQAWRTSAQSEGQSTKRAGLEQQ